MVINLTKNYIMIKISFKAFKQQPKKIICSNGYTKDIMSQVIKPKPMMMRLTTISKLIIFGSLQPPKMHNPQAHHTMCKSFGNICQLHIVNPSPKTNFEVISYKQENTMFTCNP